jgi:hypothetical protein
MRKPRGSGSIETDCNATAASNVARHFTEDHDRGFRVEDYLKQARGIMAMRLLLEGCSVRTAERITGIRRDSILAMMLIAGKRCEAVMATHVRNVPVTEVQADEAWAFVLKKEAHKKYSWEANDDTIGDCYAWIAIERNSKLVLAFSVGRRTLPHAMDLMRKLRRATSDQRFLVDDRRALILHRGRR